MRLAFFPIAACVLVFTQMSVSQSLDIRSLNWIAGDWQSITPEGAVEEHWTQPASDSMIGMSRTTRDGKTASFEYLRLELRDADVFYVAYPNARKQAEFKLIEMSPERLAFAGGDEHVQRVVYQKEGDGLLARIEGKHNGKPFTLDFHYHRMTSR